MVTQPCLELGPATVKAMSVCTPGASTPELLPLTGASHGTSARPKGLPSAKGKACATSKPNLPSLDSMPMLVALRSSWPGKVWNIISTQPSLWRRTSTEARAAEFAAWLKPSNCITKASLLLYPELPEATAP